MTHTHRQTDRQTAPPTIPLFTRVCADDELAASTSLDVGHLIKLGVAAFMIFAYAAMVSFSTDLSKCKSIPALCGCAAAGLGYLAGAGLCHLCGLMHVPPAEATPFLVMGGRRAGAVGEREKRAKKSVDVLMCVVCVGIGVDDMFVMMNSYSLAFKATSARERCATALGDCGQLASQTQYDTHTHTDTKTPQLSPLCLYVCDVCQACRSLSRPSPTSWPSPSASPAPIRPSRTLPSSRLQGSQWSVTH